MRIKALVIMLLAVFTPAANAGMTIMLNTANDPPNSTLDEAGLNDRVLKEAFRRIGIKLEIINLPSERALINANDGIDDGNFARVKGLDSSYPNLIRVPEAITRFEFVAFSKKLKIRTTGWDALNPYSVGIITGWKILEKNIVNVKSLVRVRDKKILFNLLKEDRVDIIVYDRMQGMALLKETGGSYNILEPPLAVEYMYPYLHKKHGDLLPPLAKAIRDMKKDGTYQKIYRDVMAPYLRNCKERTR